MKVNFREEYIKIVESEILERKISSANRRIYYEFAMSAIDGRTLVKFKGKQFYQKHSIILYIPAPYTMRLTEGLDQVIIWKPSKTNHLFADIVPSYYVESEEDFKKRRY